MSKSNTLRLTAVACWLLSTIAGADDLHYQTYPVGTRAVGLGGAFGAISNDPSGLYYNPAGIVDTTRATVSVSTSLYGIESNTSGGASGIDSRNLRLSTIPSEVGGTYAMGELDGAKKPGWAWGFSVLVPSSRDGTVSRRNKLADGWLDYRREQSDRTMWIGAGGAWRVAEGLSAGVSAYYLHRSVSLNQRSTARIGDDTAAFDESLFVDASDDALVAKFGLKWAATERWNFGATVTTPSAPVRSTGNARVTFVGWSAQDKATLVEHAASSDVDPLQMRVTTRLGASLRLAAAYVVPKSLTVACDVSAHMPVQYQRYQFADPDLQEALKLPENIRRTAVVNGACGAEWLFREDMSVAAGGFTDFSSAPPLRFDAAGVLQGDPTDQQPHINLFGATLGLGLYGEHSLTRFGLSAARGSGEDLLFDPRQGKWLLSNATQTMLFAFVASTFRY